LSDDFGEEKWNCPDWISELNECSYLEVFFQSYLNQLIVLYQRFPVNNASLYLYSRSINDWCNRFFKLSIEENSSLIGALKGSFFSGFLYSLPFNSVTLY
jgi:hypothetical protein